MIGFARGITILEFGLLDATTLWETAALIARPKSQTLGWHDHRGWNGHRGASETTQRTKRQARLEEARRWLERKRT